MHFAALSFGKFVQVLRVQRDNFPATLIIVGHSIYFTRAITSTMMPFVTEPAKWSSKNCELYK